MAHPGRRSDGGAQPDLSLGFTPFGLARRGMRVGNDYADEEFLELPLHSPPA